MFPRSERPEGMDHTTPPPSERRTSPLRRRSVIVAAALALVLVGCGGSDSAGDASDDGGGGDVTTTPIDTESDDGGGDTSGSDDGSDTDDSDPAGPTAELPDDFPAELAPPDDAVYRSALAGEQGGKKDWFVVASIPGDVGAVADAIVAQVEGAGYTVSSDEEGGIPGGAQSRSIQAEDDTYIVSLSVDDADVVGGVEGSANASYTVTEK